MNKKRFYIISSTLLLIGLFAGVVQYVGMFDTLYAAANNPGHSWSEMDCDSSFCISSNGVGIGTITPGEALEVNGNIKVDGNVASNRPVGADDLTTKGYVDEKIAETVGIITGAQPLVNGAHSQLDCTTAGGKVVDSDVSFGICQFDGSTCPEYWKAYKNFNQTEAVTATCDNDGTVDCFNQGWCTAPAKDWGNDTYTCKTGSNYDYHWSSRARTATVVLGVTCCSCLSSSSCGNFGQYSVVESKIVKIGCY